ncbi:1-deoxy-D-xylulose-5-phosphate synthase [Streptomyces sp. WI04-05B]|uniref:1-deoxy-D-xylulose-5-phosphate synthase n=1 Tax=Streptomyces TaxID=1883 RepID=UPI0029B62095|nr:MULTISPECIES: 1-deoxy-D-xylulose-5-phosphate synthase [unclassified Streptomyces]MDX2546537.1 1-deoxy-D-xylulose-5-phosphate synthase [Streptomyces sp. WI04-05B]MDX2587831.1 1-deoxy-D-xylulose-5-phosphate synthase [Streptomyces sp. WI04-05A]
MSLLENVRDPARLRELTAGELRDLAGEIRAFLIERVSATGGHLGPNLGVVELTIALHTVFESPRDRLLWDTGHQAYVHKILTGRQAGFDRLRKSGGISGYPSREESEHDLVENSHASTALSYADGLARADAHLGRRDRATVAIVGDGALTGGMAWEALNNIAGGPDRPLVIVLNDNQRSYAPTVGGLAEHLADLRAGCTPGVFEQFGLSYQGPIDGHDLPAVQDALRRAHALGRPVVVHVITAKGRGCSHTEANDLDLGHAIKPMDPRTGQALGVSARSFTSVFGATLVELAERREDLVAITAAMTEPTGLLPLQRRFPDRVIDVGIAEQHAVTMAAGLSMGGVHPVVAIYSTFVNRAVDQLLMDVALHRRPVTFVLDRSGVTGDDGPSHNGMWDLSVLQVVPGLRIAAPRDGTRLAELLGEAVAWDEGPTLLRFPKGPVGEDLPAVATFNGLDVLCRSGSLDVLIVAVGALAGLALTVAEGVRAQGIGVTVVDPRWVTPVNPALADLARRHRVAITVEDNSRVGGVGSAIAQELRDTDVRTPLREFGIPRRFLSHGSRAEVLAACGLTAQNITRVVVELLTGLDAAPASAGIDDPGTWPVHSEEEH